MKSSATSGFWTLFRALPSDIKTRARRAYSIWQRNPRHPSLSFRKVGDVWTIRVGRGYRALALQQGDTFYWFWIGSHDDYEMMLKREI
ncbi:hypothetical protein FJY69_05685 [candidate division WOR-3 bacterium]|nr:hypothetical protein [candidate division WOR-3 bacterium]